MPVIEKRFPNDMIQLHVRPWPKQPKYEYIICLRYKKILIPFSDIHEHSCIIQFLRNNNQIEAMLYVKMI